MSYAKGKTRQVYVPKDLQPLAERWVRNYHQAIIAVPQTIFQGLIAAESKGAYFNRNVRNRFRYQRLL